jgi:hypothetical protein
MRTTPNAPTPEMPSFGWPRPPERNPIEERARAALVAGDADAYAQFLIAEWGLDAARSAMPIVLSLPEGERFLIPMRPGFAEDVAALLALETNSDEV